MFWVFKMYLAFIFLKLLKESQFYIVITCNCKIVDTFNMLPIIFIT